ncbi:MAG: T9SS type A sorting domain-containing protein [Cyanothece sp. SIO1E1]|nr:T9SS type A sorting domain-containing protein [Cyanothece sp. SIO1E1]
MKRTVTLLFAFTIGLFSIASAQTALDPNQFVNAQITGPGVYTVESGVFYAFDGRIDLTFDVTIEGPDNGWIMNEATPPVFLNTPAADGSARNFFELKEGGSLTLKNILLSGANNNDEVVGNFVANTGGSKMIVDNCVFTDWQDFALRNQNKGDSISITNCVFINGVRLRYSPWGGFPLRMDVACDNVVIENNSVVNSGRLLANSGPFHNASVQEMHNTYLNQTVAGHEQRADEFITANNIFYNFHFIGYKTEFHSSPNNTYDSYFTTWNYFADSKNSLDSISLYLGQNLFYRDQEILDFFATVGGDSLAPSLLWEHPDVDSFIIADDNYTIGANYADMDPGFTMHPGNAQAIANHINGHWIDPTSDWVDWRIPSPVSFDGGGQPQYNSWPPAFDLSYSNTFLQKAGTDGLALGDLNWFPEDKAEFLANRASIVAAIRDSMTMAVEVYDPLTMDQTPLITPLTSTEEVDATQLSSSGNFPNPFHGITTINFGLQQHAKVSFQVFNLFGQNVYESTNQDLAPGNYQFNFDGSNLSSGMYVYKIIARGRDGRNYVTTNRMIRSN